MFKTSVVAAVIVTTCLCSPIAFSADKPIVAVFDVQDKGAGLSAEFLDNMADFIGTGLTESGTFLVVPRDQLKHRLLEQKGDSYKECYDQSCQIDLGRELAANKTLSTKIIKLGSSCKIIMDLYDLRKAASEKATSVRADCTEDSITGSVEKALPRITSSVAPGTTEASGKEDDFASKPAVVEIPSTTPKARRDERVKSNIKVWAQPAAEKPMSGLRIGAWTVLGTGLTGLLGFGTAAYLAGYHFQDERDDHEYEISITGGSVPTDDQLHKRAALKEKQKDTWLAAWGLLGAGAATTIVGLVLYLIEPDTEVEMGDSAVEVSVSPLPGGGAASVGFRF